LVSTDVCKAIQKIIGIGWLTLADTINNIFGIGYTMSADTNNVPGIRGATPPTRNPNHGEILFCAVKQPNFPTLYATASLDTAATSLSAINTTSLGASAASLNATPSPTPSPGDHAFGLDAAGGVPVVIPDPVALSPTSSLTLSLHTACTSA
jgi:hypothetical protein